MGTIDSPEETGWIRLLSPNRRIVAEGDGRINLENLLSKLQDATPL
jgi:hypothetical protein